MCYQSLDFGSWNSEQLNPAHQRGREESEGRKLPGCTISRCNSRAKSENEVSSPGNGVICQGMGAREGRLLASDWLLRTSAGL